MTREPEQAMTREPIPNAIADCMLNGCQKGKLRAEIGRLQGHMRALADTSVARDTAGIFKGLWQGSERECEELRAEVERLYANLGRRRVALANAETDVKRLKAALQRIDGINDNPADYNPAINAVCDTILRPHLEPKP